MRTSLIRLGTTFVAPLLFVSCGGGDKPASETPDAPAASTSTAVGPEVTDAGGDVTIIATSSAKMDSIGRAIYATCTTCHLANGEGMAGVYPPLAGSEIVLGAPERVVAIILNGLMGPVKVKGVEYNSVMTPWGAMFDDVQVAAVSTYIRTQWGNAAGPVSPDVVKRVRAASASRTTMWTWTELQKATF